MHINAIFYHCNNICPCPCLQPEESAFEPLAQYCESAGIPVAIVPMGFELTPPQINSGDDDEEDLGINTAQYYSATVDVSFKSNSSSYSSDDQNAWQ